jgi:HEAT repeat protein
MRRLLTRAVLVITLALAAACGPSAAARHAQSLVDQGDYAGAAAYAAAERQKAPGDRALWRVHVRAALGQHDARGAVALYDEWRAAHGDDVDTLHMMALTTIWQALESPSAQTRLAAVRAVERLEIERMAEAVAERMGDDEDVVASAAAVAILRAFWQAPQVATDMLKSADPEARAIAVAGIAKKVGVRAADDLRPMATDADPRVRRAVVGALVAFGEARDTELLAELAADPDADVRAAALRALATGKRGDHGALARAALADEHLGVRLAAVAVLGAVKDRATLTSLLGGADLVVALHAARALGKDAGDAASKTLDAALAATDWTVRAGAVNLAVALLGKAGARARLEQALLDERVDVKLAAARLLDGDVRARAVLADALAGADAHLRVQAAIDLARVDDARGLPALDAAIADPDPAVRLAAAGGYQLAHRPGPGLVTALGDDSPLVRLVAAEGVLELFTDD